EVAAPLDVGPGQPADAARSTLMDVAGRLRLVELARVGAHQAADVVRGPAAGHARSLVRVRSRDEPEIAADKAADIAVGHPLHLARRARAADRRQVEADKPADHAVGTEPGHRPGGGRLRDRAAIKAEHPYEPAEHAAGAAGD